MFVVHRTVCMCFRIRSSRSKGRCSVSGRRIFFFWLMGLFASCNRHPSPKGVLPSESYYINRISLFALHVTLQSWRCREPTIQLPVCLSAHAILYQYTYLPSAPSAICGEDFDERIALWVKAALCLACLAVYTLEITDIWKETTQED